MDILVILEDNNGTIHRMGVESIAAAQHISKSLGLTASAMVMGKNANSLSTEASGYNLDCLLYTSDAADE